jgi:Methyltransferase domain
MVDLRWHLSSYSVKVAIWLLKRSGWYEGYWNYWHTTFSYAEDKGLHIIPCHYYDPIPNTKTLSAEFHHRPRPIIGYDLKVTAALDWLTQLSDAYGSELSALLKDRGHSPSTYYLNNPAFKAGDAEILYAILRQLKPKRIVEIGSGYSTLLICQAIRANRNEVPEYQCEFTAVEPYPPEFLTPPPAELTRLVSKPIQEVTCDIISALTENDVLFIDSSHVVKIGSDVVHEFLTILPALAPGVVIHIHDIFLPAEYPRMFIDEARLFWSEQYLLEAFLTFNRKFEVIMPVHAVWRLYNERFTAAVPTVRSEKMAPCSFWIRRLST